MPTILGQIKQTKYNVFLSITVEPRYVHIEMKNIHIEAMFYWIDWSMIDIFFGNPAGQEKISPLITHVHI